MICYKCGKTISDDSVICPKCKSRTYDIYKVEQPKKINKKLLFFIASFFVIIVSIFGLIKKYNIDFVKILNDVKCFVQVNIIDTFDDLKLSSSDFAKSKKYYSVGDYADVYGLKIRMESAEVWTGYGSSFGPEAEHKILRVKVYISNISKSGKTVNSSDFKCYASNRKADEYYWDGDNVLHSGTIESGKNKQGYLYYQVPENSNSAEIRLNVTSSDSIIVYKVSY